MRPVPGSLLIAAALLQFGCGYAGEPKPPALKRPMKIVDLGAAERGSKIVVTFTAPWETTEGLPIEGPPDIELRVGELPSPWNQEAWVAGSDRIPVPQIRIVPGSTGATSGVGARRIARRGARSASGALPATGALVASGASGATGRKSLLGFAKGLTKGAAPKPIAPSKTSLFRTINIDAAKYSGKTVVIGARVHGPRGNDDGWSNIVQLQIVPTLPTPRNLQATDVPNAVHLQWNAEAPAFRIFRKQPDDTDWAQIGESPGPSFDDKTFTYGKTWQYYVESVRKVGDSWMESDASETLAFAPVDKFPPAVPAGLIVITGTRSVELSWDRVADADLAGYRIYRNGVRIADAVLEADYSDKNVTLGTKYSYQVSAVDQAGNESGQCAAVEVVIE